MNKNKYRNVATLIGLVSCLFLLTGCVQVASQTQNKPVNQQNQQPVLSGELVSPSTISDFSKDKWTQLGQGHMVALYMYDATNPTCQNMDSQISKYPELMPKGFNIFKVDYAKESDLRQQIQFNSGACYWIIYGLDGKERSRNDGTDFSSVVADMNKAKTAFGLGYKN